MFRVAAAAFLASAMILQSAPMAGYSARTFSRGDHKMPYRLFVPDARARRQPLPLVIWLHGASGMGEDNKAQISVGGNEFGSRLWVRPDIQTRYPAFVVAPQLPVGQTWGLAASEHLTTYGEMVVQLVESLGREFPIDRSRVYLLGQSMGGIGVWDLISKRPDLFAAAVPLCAAGNTTRIKAAAGVAVWAFHGAADLGMPVANTRDMVAALKAAGGEVKYTEYPDVGHDVWTRAFTEPDLPGWLFSKHKPDGACPGGVC